MRLTPGVTALLLSAMVCASANAQRQTEAQVHPGDTLGTYVVRSGDTLQGITERFLGNEDLWRENWRLNPNLRDPHLLIPGQEIRIILDRKLPPRTVQVTMVTREVDQKPSPNPWTGAEIGDLLQEEDGLRTGKKASAEVLFDNETKLQITEESLIFLRRIGSTLRGVPQETVEIIEGQADLTARAGRSADIDIEIILGGTTARPTPGPDGRAETRARQAGAGGAVMVYSGSSSVAAGGAQVEVPTGMGTTVSNDGGPPTAPERLLPATRTVGPRANSSWPYSNLRFSWRPLPAAASYVVEICNDVSCSSLVDRIGGLTESDWMSPTLPVGDLYWRVTAIAASGLDGYPSRTVPFSVTSNRRDEGPPVVATIVLGNPAYEGGDRALVGKTAAVLIDARDDASGVASVEYRWDSGTWRTWSGGSLEIPKTAGSHHLETRATDRLGRISEVFSASIDRLEERPVAPEVFASPSINAEPPTQHSF